MNDLVKVGAGAVAIATQKGSDEHFEQATATNYAARMKLVSKGKLIDTGKTRPGSYVVPRGQDDVDTDFGKSVDVLVIARRMQAEDWSNGDAPVTSYNYDSPLFQQIKDVAEQGGEDNPCRYGVCFLVYERATGRVFEWFVYGKRQLPEAKLVYPYLPVTQADIDARAAAGKDVTGQTPRGPLPLTLTSALKGKRYPSYVPCVQKCSTPFTNVNAATLDREIARFLNVSEPEVSDSGETKRAR